jgi:hypothetical protein
MVSEEAGRSWRNIICITLWLDSWSVASVIHLVNVIERHINKHEICVMLKLFPNMPIALGQIDVFKIGINAEMTVIGFICNPTYFILYIFNAVRKLQGYKGSIAQRQSGPLSQGFLLTLAQGPTPLQKPCSPSASPNPHFHTHFSHLSVCCNTCSTAHF